MNTSPRFRSKFEETVWNAAIGEGKELEYEPKSHRLPYTLACNYLPDMLLPNGTIVEIKGRLTSHDRRKMLAVRNAHPRLDIRFVFQRASVPLYRGAKMNYGQWADKHNYQWAEKTIPLEWWKE